MTCSVKNKERIGIQGVHSVLGCTGSCGKEKKIKMAPAVFTMTCLDFVLDEIKPLGFLHLDVESRETYALRGAGVALRSVDETCFVFCEG